MKSARHLIDAAYRDLTTTKDGRQFLMMLRQYFDSLPPGMGIGQLTLAAHLGELLGGPQHQPEAAMVEAALEHLWMCGEIWSRLQEFPGVKAMDGKPLRPQPVWYANRTQNTGF